MSWLDFIRDLLYRLTPYLPGIVGFLVVISFILIGALLFIVRKMRASRKADGDDDTEPRHLDSDPDYQPFAAEPEDLPLLPMRKSFQHALKILRNHVAGRDWRYAIPWYLLLGPEGAGKSTLIAHTGLDLPVGQPAEDYEDLRPACKWWFFDRGVVLDMAGALVRQREGRGSNAKAWRNFLGFLDRYRPRRPADGIILTIPIEDFLDDDGAVRPAEDITQRADAIYKKLWQAQARLGLAFPVYVIITKMDRLPGFQALVSELPDHSLADMLGWASPYSFDSEFREGWIDEAVETVGQGLQAAQMEIFAMSGDTASAEDIYQLPASFEGLREPMRLYLRQLFKPSTYHESFSPRGIWFTGDSGMEDLVSDRPVPVLSGVYGGPRARAAYPVFLQDLFETKIFPEKNMARPVKRTLIHSNKIATTAQAASIGVVVFGAFFLWLLHRDMNRDVQTVTPFIQQVGQDMDSVRAANRANASGNAAGNFNRDRALRLLEGMAELQTGSFFSILMPSSFLADIDSRVIKVTTNAFNLFILQSMGAALDERGQSIGAGRLPPEGSSTGDLEIRPSVLPVGSSSIGNSPAPRSDEFELLRRYVGAVRDFESAINRYNQLSQTNDLEDVRRLVSYLFQVLLPESFLENSDFYSEALSGANYRTIPLDAYQRDMQAKYQDMADRAVVSLYSQNALLIKLRDLAQTLDNAANSRSAGMDQLTEVFNQIKTIRKWLDDPKYTWMDDPSYDPTIAYAELEARIGGSQILGPDIAASFDAANKQGLKSLHQELPDLRSVTMGPLLAREGDRTVLRLSPAILDLYGLLESLYQRPFMQDGRFQSMPAAPSVGSAIEWDTGSLEEGIAYIDDFDKFVASDLDRVPRALHPLLRTAGGQSLERHVNDKIASAMVVPRGRSSLSLQSEESLRRSVVAFSTAGNALRHILGAYDDLGLEDSYLDLLDLSTTSALSLIREADSLFNSSSLYVPQGGDFTWWDGDANMALQAFRARDLFALRDVLAQQRGRISIIAMGYVKPVADFLNALNANLSDQESGLLSRWTNIIDELTKYDLQQADNSVSDLERFITGPMMDVTFANCGETLDALPTGNRQGDFFAERINKLSRDIRNRCLALAGVQAQSAYTAIADSFDDTLAGRYPFTLTPFESDMREVSPRDLRTFFAKYDRDVKSARLALEQADDLGYGRDQALEFITRMDRVRALFDPWLSSANREDSPVFNLDVNFRVNRDREVGGDQIIDWQFTSGSDTATLRGAKKTLRWTLGEPISLTLRWADNSTRVPAAAVDRPQIQVQGRTVQITYANIWSLIDLVRRHRSGSDDFADFVDPRPHTLRIDLPTRPTDGGPIETATVFLRVEISAMKDGQPAPLLITPFPFEAPQLEP
ncbi:MAG: type VI secretion protein IcmF/TssM N-terminal domain-containing protein [Alphaproteobacteria bacterium]|nr:type VI secretion protein IcmF/TssM N-terminal domain-containing protein [Alphaproteobacteria bacterium]